MQTRIEPQPTTHPQDDIFALENDYYVAKQAADEAIAEAWARINANKKEYTL